MNTERKILANLAWRVYRARHLVHRFERLIETRQEYLYHEAVSEWAAIDAAFYHAKQIYFDNQLKD